MEQEFIVAGYAESEANGFFALILALRKKDSLRYAGWVETGLSLSAWQQLKGTFLPLARKTSPFPRQLPQVIRRIAQWLQPCTFAQVAFTEFTPDGMVQHPSYLGIREDKTATAEQAELPANRRSPKIRRTSTRP